MNKGDSKVATNKGKNAIWIYASHSDGKVDDVVLELLGKGQQLARITATPLQAIIIGSEVRQLAEKLIEYGAETVYVIDDTKLGELDTSLYAAVIAEMAGRYKPNVLLMGADNRNAALAARTAARLGTGLSAHCVDLKFDGDKLVQTVPGFGGNILANIICPKRKPQMATVMPGVFMPVRLKAKGARIQQVKMPTLKDIRTCRIVKVIKDKPGKADDLTKASIVVAGGYGVGSKKNWKQVEKLAELLGASVGATRPPVDEGWAGIDQMIGASGKYISPKLYIALGISGMMHHTVGITRSDTIVAINNDPNAPIFKMADYGMVGDLRQVLPTLIGYLETGKGIAEPIQAPDYTRTPDAYKESLRSMRPNMYKFGRLIEDPVEDPLTRRTVEGHSQIFKAGYDPKYQELVTTISHLTGKRISRYLSVIRSVDDMVSNCRMKRLMFNLTGTCTGGRCAGWNAMNALWSISWEMDRDLGTNYHQRLTEWLIDAQSRDITLAGALTDAKGHRKLPPSRQSDPDMYLHVVKRLRDGIIVRGAKIMICGIAAANEIFVMPTTALRRSDADYAVAFALPKDAEGLTIVETRRPSDERELEDGFDIPVDKGGITQAYLFFEDVFVPYERVFMCGEYSYAGEAVYRFTLPYRSAIGGCVAGQGDVMVGAAILIARANGLPEKTFRDKLVQMIINNETTFGMGLAASVMGTQHPSGSWIPNPIIANVNKVHVATLPYETKRLLQDIAGGIGETGCMPSYKDMLDSRYGHLIRKYLKAHSPAETRMRIARLIEWLTIGAGVPGCMHGGGSPDGAKMVIWAKSEFDEFIKLAKELGNISDISLGG